MPFLNTSNTTMYYDIFEPNFTKLSFSSQVYTILLIHGFGGTPESDFGAQLPALHSHFRVIAPHLHGYGCSTSNQCPECSWYSSLVDRNPIARRLAKRAGKATWRTLLAFAATYVCR